MRIILFVGMLTLAAWGQEAATADTDTLALIDTAITVTDTSAIDTSVNISADLDDLADFADDEPDDTRDFAKAEADGMIAVEPQQKLDLVRRDHDHKRQVKLAIIMMSFIIFALTSAQSWNPR